MQGGKFYGIDASGGEHLLCTVDGISSAVWNEVQSDYSAPVIAVKYMSPADSYGNIAEIQVLGYTPNPGGGRRKEELQAQWHLAPAGSASCDSGTIATLAECQEALANLTPQASGRELSIGAGGSCGDQAWGDVPLECSMHSGN